MFRCAMLIGLSISILLTAPLAHAADTVETWTVGATDFEFYAGFDGIGLGQHEKTVFAEAVIGFGLMDRFSGYLSVSGAANEYFADGGGDVSLGIFGTPVDTDHFDLDLFLGAGFAQGEFSLTPALEMNFDLAPDLAKWGIYLRAQQALTGRDESKEDDPQTEDVDESKTKYAFAPSTILTAGTYWTVAEGHQLLLEYDMALANNPEKDEEILEIGGVAIGYNVMLTDSIEMINQVFFDIPGNGEKFSAGVSTGIVVTLPGSIEKTVQAP